MFRERSPERHDVTAPLVFYQSKDQCHLWLSQLLDKSHRFILNKTNLLFRGRQVIVHTGFSRIIGLNSGKTGSKALFLLIMYSTKTYVEKYMFKGKILEELGIDLRLKCPV